MELFEAIGFVKRGKNRFEVFKALDRPLMPSELTKKMYNTASNTYFNMVSRALGELLEKGLVKVINPNERTGRIYDKTDFGKEVENKIKEIEN